MPRDWWIVASPASGDEFERECSAHITVHITLVHSEFPEAIGEKNVLTIELADGHSIHAQRIAAQLTYRRLIEGIPTDSLNEEIVNDVEELCKRVFFLERCIIIPPTLSPREFRGKSWRELPRVLIAGSFRCFKPVRHAGHVYSALAVAWFQSSLEPLVSEQVLPLIQKLDWARHAEDFTD